MVCRDVWALHLSLLPRPPEPEGWLHAQGDQDGDSDTDTDTDTDCASSSSSESSETDSLLAELLRRASESDSSEDEDEAEAGERPRRTVMRKGTRNRYETPAGNIGVLMLACWTMRVPVMYADMIR